MFGVAGLGAWPGITNVEVGNVPVLNKTAELGHDPEFLELPEPFDREHARIIKDILLALSLDAFLTIGGFVGDCYAVSSRKINEMPGLAVLAAPKFEDFPMHNRTSRVL